MKSEAEIELERIRNKDRLKIRKCEVCDSDNRVYMCASHKDRYFCRDCLIGVINYAHSSRYKAKCAGEECTFYPL